MAQRPLYRGTTIPFAFRLSRDSRTLLEWLAARAGVSAAHYMRQIWEDHLESLGFELERGGTAVTDPAWGTPDGWVRDRSEVTDGDVQGMRSGDRVGED